MNGLEKKTADTAPSEGEQELQELQEQPEEAREAPAHPEEAPAPEKSAEELLNEQVASLGDKLLRTMAEYDNFRKRSQREKESIYPQATASAVAQFLPVADTIERALAAPCGDAEFKKGVEMILQNFKEAFSKLGIEEFGAEGDPFDPGFHNAVMHVEDEGAGAGVITEVFQKGYRLGDRIIRHAMVKVAN